MRVNCYCQLIALIKLNVLAAFRNCSVQRNSRRLRVRHGEKVVRASDCMVCQCNDGQLEDCQSPRDSDVDCSKINPGSNPQSCQRRGMTIEHGQRMMVKFKKMSPPLDVNYIFVG